MRYILVPFSLSWRKTFPVLSSVTAPLRGPRVKSDYSAFSVRAKGRFSESESMKPRRRKEQKAHDCFDRWRLFCRSLGGSLSAVDTLAKTNIAYELLCTYPLRHFVAKKNITTAQFISFKFMTMRFSLRHRNYKRRRGINAFLSWIAKVVR